MFDSFPSNHRIEANDGAELLVETGVEGWGGDIGLQIVDILDSHTVVQLSLDEARELAAALTAGADALSKLAR